LRNLGLKVGLIDADIYGPSLNEMMPVQRLPEEKDGMLRPALANGIEVISLAHFPKFEKGAFFRAPLINSIVDQFLTKVSWDNRDVLIIDLPPGTGDIQLTILQKLKDPLAILVTTPQQISFIDVEKAIYLFQRLNIKILGVIENMSYYQDLFSGEKIEIFGSGAADRLASIYNISLLGKVPIDPKLCHSLDVGSGPNFGLSYDELFKIGVEISNQLCDHSAEVEESRFELLSPSEVVLEFLGQKKVLNAEKLLLHCPCARCGQMQMEVKNSKILGAEKIGSIGLKFNFSKGCNRGIYTWKYLAEI
jgi:ATP-binding protein involved in chromosome partitioning